MSLEPYELEQFILIQSLEQICKYHQNVDNFPYKNLICVNSDKPEIVFNRVISAPPEVYKFFSELTDLQKSYLVPKISLYKKQVDENKKEKYELLSFRSYFDSNEYLKFATNPSNFDINQKKGDGVGIKSISITDRSEKPSDIHITCKLDLFFDNVVSLMNSNVMTLVTTPELRTTNSAPDYRIKLVIGWQTPVDTSQVVFTPQQIDIIEKSNIVYLLELVTHTLGFRDNGTIDLSIEYQGAVERFFGSNSQADILGVSFDLSGFDVKTINEALISAAANTATNTAADNLTAVARAAAIGFFPGSAAAAAIASQKPSQTFTKYNQYINLVFQRAIIEEQLKELYKKNPEQTLESLTKTSKNKDEKIEELEKQQKDLAAQIEELENFAIKEKYAKLLQAIWDNNRLFNMKVGASLIEDLMKVSTDSGKTKFLDFIKLFGAIKGPFVTTTSESIKDNNLDEDDPASVADLKDAKTKEEIEKAAEKAINKEKKQNLLPSKISNTGVTSEQKQEEFAAGGNTGLSYRYDGSKLIPYTTLGDIINTAVSFIPNREDINIILGPCKIGKFIINLAQIPISIVNFSIWFNNNVVRKLKKNYLLWDFLQDIIRDLVTTNLTAGKLYGEDKDSALTLGISTIISEKELVPGHVYKDDNLVNFLSRNVSNTDKVFQYLILYVYDYQLNKRHGNLEEDMKDGIYHFSVGKNKGVLKNIQLNKVDFPKYRDMLMTKDSLNGPGNILRQHYNVTMKTVGNPLFLNGGTFYFDGSYLGLLGSEATDVLGISGYYLVTGMEMSLSAEAGYETTINGTWNAQKADVRMSEIIETSKTGILSSIGKQSFHTNLKDKFKEIKF